MKKILILLLAVFCVPAFVPPPKGPAVSMASLQGLPPELQQLIILHTGIGPNGILNIPALAQGLTTLAATNKSLHAAINNPQNMLVILKSLPRAGAKVLAQRLQKMPGMKSYEVDTWLKSFELEGGKKLLAAIEHFENPDTQAILKLLANPNIAVNARSDIHNHTALMRASFIYPRVEIVRALLKVGADVNAKDNDGMTALMLAGLGGNTENVKVLIEAGADANAKDANGGTALMHASSNGHAEIVDILLKAGADVTKKSKKGNTALAIAYREIRDNPLHDVAAYNEIIRLLKNAEKTQTKNRESKGCLIQ